MPWSSNDELPDSVKQNMDAKGQTIFRSAFNSALAGTCKGDETCAMKVAWSAVQNAGFKKGADGKWHMEKTEEEPRMEFAKQLGDFEETKEGLVGAFEVFKSGTWGDKPWTSKEIDQIVGNFSDKSLGYNPAVMHTTWDGRHSYSDKDVCGRVLELKRVDNDDESVSVYAKMLFTEPETAGKVKRKEPDQFSVSLSNNPEKGWMLKHIALTPIPGVKGLRGTIPLHEFTQTEQETSILLVNTVTPEAKQDGPPGSLQPPERIPLKSKDGKEKYEMSEEEKNKLVEMTEEVRSLKELTTTQKAELEKKDAELTAFREAKKESEFTAKLDVLVGEARITPALKAKFMPLLMKMDDTVELTEGDKKVKQTDAFLSALAELPPIEIVGDKGLGFTQKPPSDATGAIPQAKLTETARQMIKEAGGQVKE